MCLVVKNESDIILTPEVIYLLGFFETFGYEGRVIGGAVRNFVLGNSVSEIDIATNMPAEIFLCRALENGIKCIPTGISHGTVTAIINEKNIEITTLRKDISTDGRHAIIGYTSSWEQDSSRRDFTFNAMYMDKHGNIFDYHNGVEDLKAGIIRFIGDPRCRIKEDFLRILRYFRFLTSYASNYRDNHTLQIIQELSYDLKNISGERIFSELMKIFDLDQSYKTLDLFLYILNMLLGVSFNYLKSAYKIGIFDDMTAELKFITLICCSGHIATENAITRLKMNSKMKKKCRNIIKFLDECESDLDFKYSLILINKENRDEFLKVLSVKSGNLELYDNISAFLKSIKHEFDMNGSDILSKFPDLEMKKIGEYLKLAKEIWAKSYGEKSMEDVLCLLNDTRH